MGLPGLPCRGTRKTYPKNSHGEGRKIFRLKLVDMSLFPGGFFSGCYGTLVFVHFRRSILFHHVFKKNMYLFTVRRPFKTEKYIKALKAICKQMDGQKDPSLSSFLALPFPNHPCMAQV